MKSRVFSSIFINLFCFVAGTLLATLVHFDCVFLLPESYVKTVAHQDIDYAGASLLFKDTTRDVAYYSWNTGSAPLSIDDTVYDSDGRAGIVVDVLADGFLIKPIDMVPTAGMSGTSIFINDTPIGLVSSVKANGNLYCIWR